MFSRFDNMMQHTQTHNKARAAPRRLKGSGGNKTKEKAGSSENSLSDADSPYDHSGLPSPPPSRRGSEHGKLANKARMRRHRQLQRKNYAENDEEDELEYDDSDDQDQLHEDHSVDSDSDSGYHILSHQHQDGGEFGGGGRSIISQQRAMFAEMRRSSREGYTLPPPAPIPLIPSRSTSSTSSSQQHMSYHQQRLSESPMSSSSSTSTTDSSSHNTSRKRPRTAPKVQFHPYPYNGKHRRHSATGDDRYVLRPLYPKQQDDDNGDHDDDDDRNDARMILPRLATYLVAHPDEPPENYFLHHHHHSLGYSSHQQEPMAQKRALTWPTLPGTTEKTITRRLSVQDLCNPIECLERSSSSTSCSSSSSPFPSSANNDDNDNNNNDGMYLNKSNDKDNKAEPMQGDTHDKTTLAPVKQEEGIDLTLDEYEAIQGFGRFQKYGGLK
ncbi:hypothetical protein BCR42DRAFT_429867 [Absidia repens]|uniref:Uncharacterized protein n=1 Tax=Absidia repens TaxID=90262 RepID=A0A1X2HR90_9FUNG|nr:hypothetical protein BCR42DRAFT_429867 [Absidia repens]